MNNLPDHLTVEDRLRDNHWQLIRVHDVLAAGRRLVHAIARMSSTDDIESDLGDAFNEVASAALKKLDKASARLDRVIAAVAARDQKGGEA